MRVNSGQERIVSNIKGCDRILKTSREMIGSCPTTREVGESFLNLRERNYGAED